MTEHPQSMRSMAIRALAALSVATCSLATAGTHPARLVPKNAAAFVVIPEMAKASERVGAFLRQTHGGFAGFDLSEFEMTVGFAPGTIDLSQPIVIVADRPDEMMRLFTQTGLSEGEPIWPVVGFTPLDSRRFEARLSGATRGADSGFTQSITGAFGTYRVVMRDGMAFVAPKSATLVKIARLREEASAWSAMSASARQDAMHSDVYVQLSMSAWRPLFESQLRAVTEIMKVGIQLQQPDPKLAEQTRRLADWFLTGALDGVQQMDSVSAALSLEGERLRVSHHHTFCPDGWVADYLRHVSRKNPAAPWRAFPDEPFLFAANSSWSVPPEYCLSVQFNRRCMSDPELCRTLSKEHREALDRKICELTKRTTGESFVVTNATAQFAPLRIMGTYSTTDAARMLEVMQAVRDHANEIFGSLVPGAAEIGGKTTLIRQDGMDIHQMQLINASDSQIIRDNIRMMYGDEAIYQEAIAGEDMIIYSIGNRRGVRTIADVIAGKLPRLSDNARVAEAMRAMPSDANLQVLVDTRRLVTSMPFLLRAGIPGAVASNIRRDGSGTANDAVGPLLGWSATVHDNHIDCGFSVKADDFRQTIEAFRRMNRDLRGGGGAPGSGLAADRPVPFVRGD